MSRRFFELAFTPAVQAEQVRRGSRALYARAAASAAAPADLELGPREVAFLGARDSFYLASVSETGWPYIQHRGGPPGFVRVPDGQTIAWAELRGNRQYVTAGNIAHDDRVALFFMDYAARRRLKLLGRMTLVEPQRAQRDSAAETPAVVRVAAFDWNCPQHITPRYTEDELARAVRRR
jgi:uncharacterized protein